MCDLDLKEGFKAVPGLHSAILIHTVHAYADVWVARHCKTLSLQEPFEDLSGASGAKAKCQSLLQAGFSIFSLLCI